MKIKKLEIATADIGKQLHFYRDLLALEIRDQEESSFKIVVGSSILKFRQDTNFTPYHIAFHIPDKQEEKALAWLKKRVSILKNDQDEIVDFSAWDAKSVYFYDEDKNIMEFIARGNLNKPVSEVFSEKSLLGIAEIGLATDDIEGKFNFLHRQCELEVFDGNFEKFCAIGDHQGLFITINKNLKDWFPTGDKAFSSDFRIEFSHKGSNYDLDFINDCLKLAKK
jgi:catechol 2,3-dioxygenase-like lactoylglutathione lyase family enzyme